MSQFQFVMRSGPTPGATFPLEGNQLTIGRDVSNAVAINDSNLSRKHAHLSLQDAKYVIKDLGSANGTFVNGHRLATPVVLRPGDVVTLGKQIILMYDSVNLDPGATMASPRKPSILVSTETQPANTYPQNSNDNSLIYPFDNSPIEPLDNSPIKPLDFLANLFNFQISKPEIISTTVKISPKIFISYSQKDIGFVKKLTDDLNSYGADTWWDVSRLKGGDTWIPSIQAALDQSQYCIVIITPDSIQSHWVQKEYTYAISNEMRVIPLYLKTVKKMPFVFSTIQHVDFRDIQYDNALRKLCAALGLIR